MTEGGSDPHAALRGLVGSACDGVTGFTVGGAATFRFGEAVLQVECLWRVVQAGRLRVTAADHGHPYGRGAPVDAPAEADVLLRGRKVVQVSGGSVDADVVVVLDGRFRLEIVPDSTGYESWHLLTPGIRLLGWGGGQVSAI